MYLTNCTSRALIGASSVTTEVDIEFPGFRAAAAVSEPPQPNQQARKSFCSATMRADIMPPFILLSKGISDV